MRTIQLKTPLNVNFTPRDVKFPKYMLPDTLGNSEAEEVTARLVTICQDENKWAGINLRDFADTLDKDAKNIKEVSKEIQTLILLDRFKISGPTFAEIGFHKLIAGGYITWEKEEDETYFLPTEKLLKAIERYVS